MPEHPSGTQRDPAEFLRFLARQEETEDLANYLFMLQQDYYAGVLTEADREYRLEHLPEDGLDIGALLDTAVFFGMSWERNDPTEEPDE